jgi:hypothetical protein
MEAFTDGDRATEALRASLAERDARMAVLEADLAALRISRDMFHEGREQFREACEVLQMNLVREREAAAARLSRVMHDASVADVAAGARIAALTDLLGTARRENVDLRARLQATEQALAALQTYANSAGFRLVGSAAQRLRRYRSVYVPLQRLIRRIAGSESQV